MPPGLIFFISVHIDDMGLLVFFSGLRVFLVNLFLMKTTNKQKSIGLRVRCLCTCPGYIICDQKLLKVGKGIHSPGKQHFQTYGLS